MAGQDREDIGVGRSHQYSLHSQGHQSILKTLSGSLALNVLKVQNERASFANVLERLMLPEFPDTIVPITPDARTVSSRHCKEAVPELAQQVRQRLTRQSGMCKVIVSVRLLRSFPSLAMTVGLGTYA